METQVKEKPSVRRWTIAVKAVLFLAIGVVLFFWLQKLFVPNDLYYRLKIDYFSTQQEDDDLQVLLTGSSHMAQGVFPMQMYEENGILSYNVATSSQNIEGSYYLLEQALNRHDYQVFVLDVSGLFFSEDSGKNSLPKMRFVLDAMPLTWDKVEAAQTYANLMGEDHAVNFWSVIFPILQYHGRWDELSISDFANQMGSADFFDKGGLISPYTVGGTWTEESMNQVAEAMLQSDTAITVTYDNGAESVSAEADTLYSDEITQENLDWLLKIQALCQQHNCELLLVKVPCIFGPNTEWSSWTEQRSQTMKEVAQTYGMEFLDLLYDVDLGIDVAQDCKDGGAHLNYKGAQKVTAFLGAYLKEHYGLEERTNDDFAQSLQSYHQLTQVADRVMTTDMVEYLTELTEHRDDLVIALSVGGDVQGGLNPVERRALQKLGLQLDFETSPAYRDSYVAVLDGGSVVYESASNREITYSYETDSGTTLELNSQGFLVGDSASITVDGQILSSGSGLNLVVLDRASGLPVDGVRFATCFAEADNANHEAIRDVLNTGTMFWAYEAYLMHLEGGLSF